MNQYWRRFKSRTPRALKKLQRLMIAISGASGAAMALLYQYDMGGTTLFSILTYVASAAAFAVTMLQFATTDSGLSETTPRPKHKRFNQE